MLIGDFLSPLADIGALVKGFASYGIKGHILQVLDPAEHDLPYSGRTRFHGLEGEGVVTFGRAEIVREDFARRIGARHEALVELARSLGWTFSSHSTERPPETAVLTLYTALAEGIA